MAQPVDDLDLGLPDNRLCEVVALAVADRGFDPGCGRAGGSQPGTQLSFVDAARFARKF